MGFPQTRRVVLYDTTLRDGMQGEGVALSLGDKLGIARRLDELGMDYIEGGYPLSNPKDAEFFQEMRRNPLSHARLTAFGMTRKKGQTAAEDVGLGALLSAETPAVAIVGKTWELHVRDVLGVTPEENLAMIADSIAHCAAAGREVIYDAEHFFDGYAANPEYARRTLLAAQEAGASCIVLCDTNGGSLPERIVEFVEAVRSDLSVPLGIHPHNDGGLAVSNAISAVKHGVYHVQGTINGIGERCGNVDLTTVAANLTLKLGYDVLVPGALEGLTEVSRYVDEMANLVPRENQPYVGSGAFAHKGGMHVHAVQKVASSYEHVDPVRVGNRRRILISELSGASTVAAKIGKKFGIAEDRPLLRRVLERVQERENEGYTFEAAEASFELICRKEMGRYHPFWELDHYRAVILNVHGQIQTTEAIVKLRIDGVQEHQVAEGDGPVDALAGALLRALRPRYPHVDRVRLVDYKVRVTNPREATAARVRVTIQFRDDESHEVYGTVGVSENIIEASWDALVDGIEYKLLQVEEALDTGVGVRRAGAEGEGFDA
ncbi:MAG: citramalate synthase [Phycisphaerae bacterium]|nr:citramalate synthase [Phycisphaerae bacterium]